MNVDRLVEQAREYCSGAMRKQGEALVAGLADAVERLERDRKAWETAWFRDTDRLTDEADEARARVAALEAGIKDHRLNYANPFAGWTEREANERLWALLDGRVPSTGQETT